MIAVLSVRFRKCIAWLLYLTFYADWAIAAEMGDVHGRARTTTRYDVVTSYAAANGDTRGPVISGVRRPMAVRKAVEHVMLSSVEKKEVGADEPFTGGPSQPEMQGFHSVNSNNMVDLFSGDFSYNIPLLDVGGYPVNIAYHSGIGMDDDASWVGLGWNVNPGSITRSMRGLPDDFNGGADTVKKVGHIKANLTFGANVEFSPELVGLPLVGLNINAGIYHSTYNGWGLESGLNVSLRAGSKSFGPFSGGLSLTNSSQNGITVQPNLGVTFGLHHASDNGGFSSGLNLGTSYNARTGIKALQLGINDRFNRLSKHAEDQTSWNTAISFAGPTYCPTITLPMSNYNYSFTAKWGTEFYGTHPALAVNGYMSKEYVASTDTVLSLPAYGYLNFQNIKGNWRALTDFNREKEMPYRESPAVPHIAVPVYTYDVFTIGGEGTGGMFRAYRGDIGFIADHLIQNKTQSVAGSLDIGGANGVHWGGDLNVNYSTTRSGPWLPGNLLGHTIGFRQSDSIFQSAYFRNPGEKTINTTAFYDAIGGDNVVAPALFQSNNSDPNILAVNKLNLYNRGQQLGSLALDSAKAHKASRDKRSEVISYLTASEASVSGLDKHIVHYAVNKFAPECCSVYVPEDTTGSSGTGLVGYYYTNEFLQGQPVRQRLDPRIYFDWSTGSPYWNENTGEIDQRVMKGDFFSARWLGRIKIPDSGCYKFAIKSDDGVRMWLNDSLVIDDWHVHPEKWDSVSMNMVGNKFYNIRLEYFEQLEHAVVFLTWKRPGEAEHVFTPQQ
ncbi:MAG TPA: PA14 domain-containing protein, partial [Puia sp.]